MNAHFLLQQVAFLYLHCVFKQNKASVSMFSLAREILNSTLAQTGLWNAETIWTVWCRQNSCPNRAILDDVVAHSCSRVGPSHCWGPVLTITVLHSAIHLVLGRSEVLNVCFWEWSLRFAKNHWNDKVHTSEVCGFNQKTMFSAMQSEYIGYIEAELSSLPALFLAFLLWSCPGTKKRWNLQLCLAPGSYRTIQQ